MFIKKGDMIMSDSEKLRKKQGNLYLTLSFFLFAIAICGIWSIFIYPWGLAVTLIGIFPTIFICMSICISYGAYETFTAVDKSEIDKCDSAKLRKINGISELVSAFVFLTLAISNIWAIFVFAELTLFLPVLMIPFGVFAGCFYGCVILSVKNFMEIEKLVIIALASQGGRLS